MTRQRTAKGTTEMVARKQCQICKEDGPPNWYQYYWGYVYPR